MADPEIDYANLVREAEAARQAAAGVHARSAKGFRPESGRNYALELLTLPYQGVKALGGMHLGALQSAADLFERAKQESTSAAFGGDFNPQPGLELATNVLVPGTVRAIQPGAAIGELGMAGGRGPKPTPGPAPEPQLGRHPTTTPERIIQQTAENTGYTVHVPTGTVPSEGLLVGSYANKDPRTRVLDPGQMTPAALEAHAVKNREPLAQADKYYGTWTEPETGKTYLDVTKRFEPGEIRPATKFGERTGQISGYDVAKKETFPVGSFPEFVAGPDYAARLDEMAKIGREYLAAHPAPEWWSTPAFERVYGKENMPQVAGFTAATAPNAAPRENLQTMSEYMRRHILGEPTLQPDWRVPAGQMSRKEGGQIGMEESRKANLEKAARGDLQALSREKVREEALALTGDPRAVVVDRHQVRLAEAPERGVYASTQEGSIGSGKQGSENYANVKAAISKRADEVRRPPRDFSADVWTGIRETIKTKSELYGTKFRGSAITGESKSYNDLFEDLLRDKAAHMKIPQPEFERRLRNGDATLLTALLSTPAIASLFAQLDFDPLR